MKHATYKGWSIDFNAKPIPTIAFDYDCSHPDYDGEMVDDAGNELAFCSSSIEAAKMYIDDMGVEAWVS